MKRLFLLFFPVLLLAGNLGFLGALEMELNGGANFMTYHPDRTRAHTEINNEAREYEPYPMGIGSFYLRGDITDTMGFNICIERDNILQNSFSAKFKTLTDNFRVEFGPFIGVCDSFDTPDVGISGTMELMVPGIVFLSLSGFSTIGTQLDFTSDNFREGAEVKLGVWLPKMILSASAGTRNLSRFSEDHAGILTRRDSLTRYLLNLVFFSKGMPFSASIEGGYQVYSRNYKRGIGNWEYTDEVSSFFAGLELKAQVTKQLNIKFGAEMPLFFKVPEPMTVTPDFWNFPKFYAGFVYSFSGRNK